MDRIELEITEMYPAEPRKPRKVNIQLLIGVVMLVLLTIAVLNLPVRSIESYTGQCQSCMAPELHPNYIVQPVWRWIIWRLDREFGDFAIDDPFGWR